MHEGRVQLVWMQKIEGSDSGPWVSQVISIGYLGSGISIQLCCISLLSRSPSLLTQRLVYTLNNYVPLIVIDNERSLEIIHSP